MGGGPHPKDRVLDSANKKRDIGFESLFDTAMFFLLYGVIVHVIMYVTNIALYIIPTLTSHY